MNKMKFILLSVAALCFASTLKAEPVIDEIVTKNGITVIRNLRYADAPEAVDMRDSTDDRIFDLYIPKKADKPYNVLVFVHGGGFSGGNKGGKLGYNTLCDALAQRGVAVMSINYRLHVRSHRKKGEKVSCGACMKDGVNPNGFLPLVSEAVEVASSDLSLALKWIAKNGKEYDLNKNNVAISGGSAGAITCLHAAYVAKKQPVKISAVVNFWGSIENLSKVRNLDTPTIMFHGDNDKLVHVDYSREFYKILQKHGNKNAEYIELTGKGHAQYNLIERTYCDKIIDFLNKQFK